MLAALAERNPVMAMMTPAIARALNVDPKVFAALMVGVYIAQEVSVEVNALTQPAEGSPS